NNINLLDYKSKKTNIQKHKAHAPLRTVAISLLFLVSTLSVVLFILIALSPLPELSKKKRAAQFNLSLATKDIVRLGLINDRVDGISAIIKKRPRYDELLDKIQNKLPPGVAIESFQIKKNNLSINVNSRSLFSLNEFLNSMVGGNDSASEFPSIKLSNISNSEPGNDFLVTLNITIQ
ncbi:MAG TPA: PilN domain-containing protein, partial [Xanthomonadales bacterium]|nr:PilN domain-containing protein [Xanthomonadales bacterium]